MNKHIKSGGRRSKTPLPFDSFISVQISRLAGFIFSPDNQMRGLPNNITVREWQVIAALGAFGKMTNKEINTFVRLDHVAVSRAIKSLKTKNIIETQQSDFDKRSTQIQLTEQGLAMHDNIVPQRIKVNLAIDKGLTKQEKQTYLALTAKLEKHVQSMDD